MKLVTTASLALSLLAACHGSELTGHVFDRVTTTLDPTTITAGGNSHVICGVEPESSLQFLDASQFSVRVVAETGSDSGFTLTGTTLAATRAGTYRAFCELPNAKDEVGALLTVTAGEPVSVRPEFDHNPAQVRDSVGVICAGVDSYGNSAALPFPVFVAASSLTFTDTTVVAHDVGTFPVTCSSQSHAGLPQTSVDYVIVPGDPVTLELKATPDRPGYNSGAQVTLSWVAYDEYGNALADLPGTLTAPTQPALTALDEVTHKFRLEAEGIYHFTVRLDAPYQSLTDDLDLLVDDTAPTVTITFPERGATLLAQGAGPVVVRGKVTDAGGLAVFKINSAVVAVGADGSFAHAVDSDWGLNVLDIVAVDKADNVTTVGPTYHYSDGYLSFVDQNAQGLQLPDALEVLLAQGFFDDGVHDPAKLDDVATVLEVALGSIDIGALVDPLFAGVNQEIPLLSQTERVDFIQGVSWANVKLDGKLVITLGTAETTGVHATHVDIDSRQGGLDFSLSLGDAIQKAFALDLQLQAKAVFTVTQQGCSPIGCTSYQPAGVATAALTLYSSFSIGTFDVDMSVDIDKSLDGPMNIDFVNFDSSVGTVHLAPIQDVAFTVHVNVQGLGQQDVELHLSDFIDLDALFGSLFDDVLTGAANLIPQLLNPLIEAAAGPVLSGLFDLLVIDTSIPLPSLFDANKVVDLGFHTEVGTVAFTDDGGSVGIKAGLYSEKDIQRDPLGAILRGDCLGEGLPDLDWDWDPTVGIGVRTDLVNAAFFAAWWGGLLNGPIDLGALGGAGGSPIPLDGLKVTLNWLLPPIVNDCSKLGVVAQIGDLGVHLEGSLFGSEVVVDMYVDLTTAIQFLSHTATATTPGGLGIVLGEFMDDDVEVVYLDDGGLGELFDVRSLLETLPDLLEGYIAGQELGPIELPSTDLSTLLPGLPAGTTLGLGQLEVVTGDGYVVLGGNLE